MKKGSVLLFGIIILILTLLTFPKLEPTGYAVASNSLDLDLDSSKFATNTPIQGNLNLSIAQNLDPNEELTLTINSDTYTYTIKELLELSNYTIEYDDVEYEVSNEATQKSLVFTGAESKLIGLKIPRYSEISSLTFSMTSSQTSSYPSAVTLDVGDEGIIDWSYTGTLIDYNTNTIKSNDLDTTKESTGYITDNETYYCEFLSIPKTKDINISAEYTTKSSKGDLKAVILSVPTGNPKIGWAGSSNACDLPESGKKYCTISLDYPIEGNYLVCIYSSSLTFGETLYEIPLDTSAETTSAFTCPTKENSICQETGFTNFFISVNPGNYNTYLVNLINITKWETFTGSIITGVRYYVGSEPYAGVCKSSVCSIPINVTSNTAGNLLLGDLSIVYSYNGLLQSSNAFYDLTLPTSNIISIEAQDLDTGAQVSIPLENLNIQLNNGDYTIEVNFLDLSATDSFTVKDSTEILDGSTLITTAITKYTEYLNEESDESQILAMLGKTSSMQSALTSLNSLKAQIGFTGEQTLLQQTESILDDLPWDISYSQTSSDNLIIEPQDIPSALGDEEEIYKMQNAINVLGTQKIVAIEYYNENSDSYSFIHKTITAKEDIENAKLYEKSSYSFDNMLYTPRPDSISNVLATYEFNLEEDETQDYYYLSNTAMTLDDLKTIIVLSEEVPDYSCGDNTCSKPYEDEDSCPEDCIAKYPWLWMIIISILAVFAILLILFKIKK